MIWQQIYNPAGNMVVSTALAAIPVIIMLAPLLLFPATPVVWASMTLPILIPFVYFAVALNKIYRSARLGRHGLDPDLVNEQARRRDADLHRAYEQRFGPRT